MKNMTCLRRSSAARTIPIVLTISSLFWAGTIHAQWSTGLNSENLARRAPEGSQTKMANAVGTVTRGIPGGTVLPVALRSSVSFEKCKPGQLLLGKIAQDVPLPDGSKIRRGSTIEGHVVETKPNAGAVGAQVTIQFDKVNMAGQWVPIVTNLRAIAGFVAVAAAQIPDEAPGEGTPYNWLPTTQIGGDTVYGVRGPVMSADDTSKVIGRSVGDGGVLSQLRENVEAGCRGALDNSDRPQALWVFSAHACGIYGIEHLKIAHAGRTSPRGTIILASETQKLSLKNGDGLLLRVD